MAEFRNESKAAKEFVQKTLEEQRKLEQQAQSASKNDYPRLGDQEHQLEQSLKDFEQQHPQVFKGTESASKDAQAAMEKSANSLQKKLADSKNATRAATEGVEKLNSAMLNQSTEQQLADAYRLKQMLDKQIQTLDEKTQPENKVSDSQLQQTATDAKETLNQLKRTAEQEPTRDAFGQPLRDALSGQNKVDLDARLNQLQQAAKEAARNSGQSGKGGSGTNGNDSANSQAQSALAAAARDGLDKVSKAFSASEPKATQLARKEDSLKPSGEESMNLGMSELQSLLKMLEKEGKLSDAQRGQQGEEALYNLQTGMRNFYGSNERGDQILVHLKEMIKGDKPMEIEDLKKLMDELQRFSVEHSEKLAKKDEPPEVTNIDPQRLPPAYRGRIQKYFQKLSEK